MMGTDYNVRATYADIAAMVIAGSKLIAINLSIL
jgi:hypothetical protein